MAVEGGFANGESGVGEVQFWDFDPSAETETETSFLPGLRGMQKHALIRFFR